MKIYKLPRTVSAVGLSHRHLLLAIYQQRSVFTCIFKLVYFNTTFNELDSSVFLQHPLKIES